jgi:hypothetical protein
METPAPVALTLAPGEQLAQQGDVVEIEVFINNPVQCLLLGYQLHTGVTGGSAGHLELIDLSVEPRNDFVFNGVGHGKAFNLGLRQMLVGVDEAAIAMPADLILVPASLDYAGYLATFTYRVSDDASGSFLVDLLAVPLDSDAVSENRTFVFGSPLEAATADVAPIDDVAVSGVAPALVTVEPGPAPSSLPDGKKEPTTERRRSRKPR